MKQDKWIIILAISLVSLLALTFYFFSPLLDGIVMGIVFAYVAKPFKKRLEKIGRIPSALIATLIIIIPISILMFYGIFQGINQAVYIITHQKLFEERLIEVLTNAGIEKEYIEQIRGIFPSLLSIIQNTLRISAFGVTVRAIMFLMNFLISTIVCFYALIDSENFIERTMRILPEDRREEFSKFIKEVDDTFLGLWFGNFIVAMLIGLASIPFFIYFNIPFTPLLSGLMFLAALIPIFAEWMILLPVAAYLATQSLSTAIWFLVIGFTFLYFLPEIILRPYFVGYTSKIHPLVLMLAFIGGAVMGGVAGFFIAPMVAGLITAVYHYYTK
ncbi:AI-2E family transporter [Archaeoglobales archaeon]|nr:MAG: AI-2E family transporter [Archaeoglobales archaeon]